jgi:hypothetical protein
MIDSRVAKITSEISAEVARTMELFPVPMHSVHEALGVIREEYIEYEDDVFAFNLRKGKDTRPHMRKELIHLAAMCVKAIMYTIDTDVETQRVGYQYECLCIPKPNDFRHSIACAVYNKHRKAEFEGDSPSGGCI